MEEKITFLEVENTENVAFFSGFYLICIYSICDFKPTAQREYDRWFFRPYFLFNKRSYLNNINNRKAKRYQCVFVCFLFLYNQTPGAVLMKFYPTHTMRLLTIGWVKTRIKKLALCPSPSTIIYKDKGKYIKEITH